MRDGGCTDLQLTDDCIPSEKENAMPSSVPTYEDLTNHYTTAMDALYEIARGYLYLGRVADAQHLLRTALQLVEAQEMKPQDRLKVLLLYGTVLTVDYLLVNTDADLMFSIIVQAKHVAEVAQDQQGIADALSLLGQAHYLAPLMRRVRSGASPDSPQDQGELDEALAYQQQALELREALHDTRGVSESHFWIGVVYERWQQYEQTHEHYVKALQIAEQSGYSYEKTEPTRHLASYALRQGDLDQALTYAKLALSLREEAGFRPYLPLDHLRLRDIYQAKGETANAQLHTEIASTIAKAMGYPTLVSIVPPMREGLAAKPEEA
jgi:tetratricopeptide (TPR) repeat protein